MIPVLSSAQARAFDRFLGERCAVPSLLLMENAGRAAADIVHQRLSKRGGVRQRVLCVCGPGNNGGDGLVVARQLLRRGYRPVVVLFGRAGQAAADARANLLALRGVGGQVHEVDAAADGSAAIAACAGDADVIIDALLGTGLSRELEGPLCGAVEAMNASGLPIFALDVPSGLNADTGAVHGAAVRAQVTITFGHPKTGLLTSAAVDLAGELVLADLGVPRELGPACQPRARWIEAADVAGWLEPRPRSVHKTRAGRVLVIAGSVGKTGAALLASNAALSSGAGLVTLATFPEAAQRLDQRVLEVMTQPLEPERLIASLDAALDGVDVALIGPGLGLDERARAAVDRVVLGWPGTKIVDADAITHFQGRARELRAARGVCLFTPHPGELGRLLGASSAEVEADRFGAVEQATSLTGQTLLLKGPHTLIAEPGQPPWVSSSGLPVLATAGAGDVLSGVCAAFAANAPLGRPGATAAPLLRVGAMAAHVHGRAACLWSAAQGGADRGMLAHELSAQLPRAIAELLGARAETQH